MRYRSYNNGGNFFWFGILLFFMFGGVKTLLLLLPLLTFLPIILIGIMLFRVGKKINYNQQYGYESRQSSIARSHYIELLVHFASHVIKADGKIDQLEIQSVFTFFQQKLSFSSRQLLWVQDLLHHALQQNINLQDLANEFNNQYGHDEKVLLIECLSAVIISDNDVSKLEIKVLDEIARLIQIDSKLYQNLKNTTFKGSKQAMSDFEILGVSSNSTNEEIKKAYKELCKKFHPDRVQHLGDEFKVFAEDKLKKINKAYDNIQKIKT